MLRHLLSQVHKYKNEMTIISPLVNARCSLQGITEVIVLESSTRKFILHAYVSHSFLHVLCCIDAYMRCENIALLSFIYDKNDVVKEIKKKTTMWTYL